MANFTPITRAVAAPLIPSNLWRRRSGFGRTHLACSRVSMVAVGAPAEEIVPLADGDSWLVGPGDIFTY